MPGATQKEGTEIATKMFDLVDKDKSGEIDQQEFTKAQKIIVGSLPSEIDLVPHLDTLDTDGSGTVDKKEWLESMRDLWNTIGISKFCEVGKAAVQAVALLLGKATKLPEWKDCLKMLSEKGFVSELADPVSLPAHMKQKHMRMASEILA